jgi:PAS domain S-box-containing protein
MDNHLSYEPAPTGLDPRASERLDARKRPLRPVSNAPRPSDALRDSGLPIVGEVAWGAHFCQFYQTREDLLDILVPYFRAGLENNEFCMWIASQPLHAAQAKTALAAVIPDLDQRMAAGQIEILDYQQWYVLDGTFDADRVLRGWVDKLEAALRRGFEGLRLTGNTFWLEDRLWKEFSGYEGAIDSVIGRYQMLALCTYSLDKCGAFQVMDVVRNHQFALIRQDQKWEVLQSMQRKAVESALRESEARYHTLFRTMDEGFALHEILCDGGGRPYDYRFLEVNPAFERQTGLKPAALVGRTVREVLPGIEPIWIERYGRVALTGQPEQFEAWSEPLGRWYDVRAYQTTPGRFAVVFTDITERKQAEEQLREAHERLLLQAEELQAANDELLQNEQTLRSKEQRVRLKLDSILSPEGDLANLELADIIDAQAIQSLMDDFYRLARIPMAVIDLKGRVLVGVGWQTICTRFHRVHPETCRYCIESDTQLTVGVPPGESRLYKCKNHMWDIATPLMVAGQHVGNLFSGQFFFEDEPVDRELFRAQAQRYGFDERDYLAALEAVPRLSRETLDTGMAFLMKLARMISQLSYGNIQLARSLGERDRLMESLHRGRERLNRAQEIAHLGSWELDLTCNELTWSDEAYRIFGLEPQEFGATYEAFLERVHPEDRAAVDAAYVGSLRENRDTYEIDHRVVRKDTGEIRIVHEKCEHFRDAAGRIIRSVGMVHDITESTRAQDQLLKLNRTLKALSNSNQALMRATEESVYLREVCKIVVGDCGHAMVWIGYAEEDEAKHVRPVAWAGLEAGYLATLEITWADTERGRGPTGTAIRTGRPAVCRNMLTDPSFAPWREQALQRGYASSLVLPLLSGGKAFGAITIYARQPEAFSQDEIDLLMELAGDLTQGITSLRLRAAHAQMTEQLRRLNDQLEEEVQAQTEELKDSVARLQEEVDRRVRVEDVLRRRSQMLEAFFQHTITPLAFMDRHLSFVRVNAAYAQAAGKEPEYFVGENHFALYPHDENRPIFERVLQTKQPYVAFAKPFAFPETPPRVTYWNWLLTPLLDERGDVQFLVLNLEDVTERQKAFQELEHRARQLQELTLELSQAEDRERKRLSEILHDDLQQQLAAAKFHLSLLGKRVPKDTAVRGAVAQLDQILKDAIEKSRSLSHELSPAVLYQSDLGETFEWLARQLKTKHGLMVHVESRGRIDSPSEALKVFFFKTAREILFNIVKHARVREARLRIQRLRGGLWLTISDQGQGFDPRSLGKTGGFGLLSIRERIELLGGRMKIRSAPGRGSTFLITVPDGEEETMAARAEGRKLAGLSAPAEVLASAPSLAGGARLRVLLVDDHKVMREGLAALLNEQSDLTVVGQAGNGREAVDLAYRLHPDVVVIDVAMPLMSGDEATRQIKLQWPRARVVALSMFEEADMADAMRQAGAEMYLLKTAPSDELLAAIRGR